MVKGNSFPKKHRLRGRSNFLKALRGDDCRRRRGRYCQLALADTAGGPTRFGITVSAKVGNSVRRNRVKRVIREYLRSHKSNWPAKKLVVISVKSPIVDERALVTEIDTILKELC